jgi:hypothetical protein
MFPSDNSGRINKDKIKLFGLQGGAHSLLHIQAPASLSFIFSHGSYSGELRYDCSCFLVYFLRMSLVLLADSWPVLLFQDFPSGLFQPGSLHLLSLLHPSRHVIALCNDWTLNVVRVKRLREQPGAVWQYQGSSLNQKQVHLLPPFRLDIFLLKNSDSSLWCVTIWNSHGPSGQKPGPWRASISVSFWHCTYIPVKLSQKPQKTWTGLFLSHLGPLWTGQRLSAPLLSIILQGKNKTEGSFPFKRKKKTLGPKCSSPGSRSTLSKASLQSKWFLGS